MSDILSRIRNALSLNATEAPHDGVVIYLGQCEWYDLLQSMRGCTPVTISYVKDVRRCTCYGVEVIVVDLPKYLRVT